MTSKVTTVRHGKVAIGPDANLTVIAGLCVVEDEETTMRHARALQDAVRGLPVSLVFKASFDKANRTSVKSYRGPGMREGLRILGRVKETLGLPILTDVHECFQVEAAAEVADVLQIPAFLCRQTDLIAAAAQTGRIVNVKKGQFLAPQDMQNVITKVLEMGSELVTLTERGTSFGYHNLVNDFRGLVVMRAFGYPVIFDATHSVQIPGGAGEKSSGDRRMIPPLARAAVAVGIDGLFFEVHEDPAKAKSDADNALPLADFARLLKNLLAIRAAAGQDVD
jgi:2-dehydro-3-deoxyphosphooctonate aldolase (KDO 8-P synthase)